MKFIHKNINSIVEDAIFRVKTPTPPLPDLNNPEVCKSEFESKNSKKHLYYTALAVNWFRYLKDEIFKELSLPSNSDKYYWDLNIDFITKYIEEIKDEDIRFKYERLFSIFYEFARKEPLDRLFIKIITLFFIFFIRFIKKKINLEYHIIIIVNK